LNGTFFPVPLTTWWKFNEQELMDFVGKDIIIYTQADLKQYEIVYKGKA
jgi:hypothetical protein